ncbi:unnamed protein product [Candida verbasci]|uniref:PRELI/MSF1 domain-containing protein n=1 Tax=Candida verbasci TaxID=1227364 RepID=A0A9W4TRW5_9ASCO|nr:unnamed protein product [Candida verbasci]
MVLYFESKHSYNYDFETTSLAYLNRYPNPFAKHVLSIDTLDYHIDSQGQLCKTNLIVKQGRLPKFIKPFIGSANLKSWIIEKIIINPKSKSMITYTSNIDHHKFIRVEEMLKYREKDNNNTTEVLSKVKFSSNLFGFKRKIEQWSHERFKLNYNNTKDGLTYVMNKLKQRRRGMMVVE